MKGSLYVVLPAYNEEENIETVVKSWYAVLDGKDEESRIVIADSGSSDRTHEILVGLGQKFPKLIVLSNTGRYHGDKVIALYDYAVKDGAEWIFQTDSDGQTDPDEFPAFWDLREEYDGIFANRPVRGDGVVRAFVEKVVCLLLRLYFGVKVPDANAPFRLMRADIVKKYLYRMDKNYNLPNIMIVTYFAYYGERHCFRDISFRPRQGGKNSINISKIIKIGCKAIGDFKKLKEEMHGHEQE